MGYTRQTFDEMESTADELDALESQVLRVLRPFLGKQGFSGEGISSRYLALEGPGGNWAIRIRVSDHANTTTDPRHGEPDVNLTTECEYADESIWRSVRRAFWKNVE